MSGSAFQITAVSFSPSTVAYGETTTMTVTVKNVSGAKVTKVCVWGHATIPTVDYKVVATSDITYHAVDGPTFYFAGTAYYDESTFKTVSWANNTTMTFSGDVLIKNTATTKEDKINLPEYHWGANKSYSSSTVASKDIGIRFSVYQPNVNNGECSNINLQGSTDELLHIITTRDHPRITLNTDRSTNGVLDDEGVNLLTDVKLNCDSTSSVFQSHGYSASISCTPTPTGGCVFGASIAQMLTGISGSSSVISGTFSNGTDYSITLTVSNGYESCAATVSILKSFANVHMSGMSTGGVCFGGFSSAEENSPKFECYFPAYFYGGIPSEQYKNGDVVTLYGGVFYGFTSNSSKSITFTVPLRKSLEKINSATVTQLKANIANSGGYAITSSYVSGGSSYMGSAITRGVNIRKEQNVLEVTISRSSSFSLTNNNTLSVRNEALVITLNE